MGGFGTWCALELFKKKIQNFFYEERNEELGIIAAGNIYDFFLNNFGDIIYNKALDEAKVWFTKRIEDIEIDYDLLYRDRARKNYE